MSWKTEDPPESLFPLHWRESWQVPGWTLHFWTDSDIAQYAESRGGIFNEILTAFSGVHRADAFRYLILEEMGGLYVDLDMVRLQSLDWLGSYSSFACGEHQASTLCNAWMWAPNPKDPFFDGIHQQLLNNQEVQNPVEATGPTFLTHYARKRKIHRLPPTSLYPVAWNDFEKLSALASYSISELQHHFPEAKSVHLWTASWMDPCYLASLKIV